MSFTITPEVQRIFDGVTGTSHSFIITACAGSGKTSTLVELLNLIVSCSTKEALSPFAALTRASYMFLAFNKSIATELKSRVPASVSCSTFHSLGFSALKDSGLVDRKVRVDGRKCVKLVYNALGDPNSPEGRDTLQLVSIAKSTPFNPDNIDYESLINHHGLSFESTANTIRIVKSVLNASLADLLVIDFDDMLWLPVLLNAEFRSSDFVFVDEAQDTNLLQLEILTRSASPATRFIFVGDPFQAIYGFRGAGSNSMTVLQSRFNCVPLPLSFSYRCATSIVTEAQKYTTLITQ